MTDSPPRLEAREDQVAGADTNIRKPEYITNGAGSATPSGAETLARAQSLKAAFSHPDGSLDPREIAGALATDLGLCPTPLRSNGKEPILAGFNTARATNDAAKVRDMFSDALGEPLDCNVGIVNGQPLPDGSVLLIVDLDTKGSKDGKVAAATLNTRYAELETALGVKLPQTVMVRSVTPREKAPSRGAQLYFWAPTGYRPRVKSGVLPGVDCPIQGVTAGSKISNDRYAWEPGRAPWEIEIAEAPSALLDLFRDGGGAKAATKSPQSRRRRAALCDLDKPEAIEWYRCWLRDEAPDSLEGNGGRRALIRAIQKGFDVGLSSEGVFETLTEEGGWNETKADPPWDDSPHYFDGFRRLVDDLCATNRDRPIGYDFWRLVQHTVMPAELAFEAIKMTEAMKPRNENAAGAATPYADLSLAGWLARDIAPKEFLLGDVFHKTSRWMIYGDTGAGKTLFALNMAAAIAAGRPFLEWQGRRPARVVYLDGEISADTFKQRLAAVADEYGSEAKLFADNRDVLGSNEMPPLNTTEGERWLLQMIDRARPDTIVFEFDRVPVFGRQARRDELGAATKDNSENFRAPHWAGVDQSHRSQHRAQLRIKGERMADDGRRLIEGRRESRGSGPRRVCADEIRQGARAGQIDVATIPRSRYRLCGGPVGCHGRAPGQRRRL